MTLKFTCMSNKTLNGQYSQRTKVWKTSQSWHKFTRMVPSLRQCHADETQVHQLARVESRNKAINMQPNDPGQLANARKCGKSLF